ncbi:hypothetical protein NG799_22150 [Laspinema sp. D1]|uniref:Uncharacterized protein n=1 Tax=Laspinema palackyanum D2a TaxID=2953684 RepID=A0ABT2MW84_9CYAN|nr:hypothetical protein [Laspinema sp. D2b]MCT7969019.1 hypothetical protein [Laspinema sp. D2a]
MKIQTGDCLISRDGRYYRVIDCCGEFISLMPIQGYTVFTCRQSYLESSFGLVETQQQVA